MGGRGAHYKMIKNSKVGRGVTEKSASEVSVLTQIYKLPKEVLKYSFLHVSLLKNDSSRSSTDEIQSTDGKLDVQVL